MKLKDKQLIILLIVLILLITASVSIVFYMFGTSKGSEDGSKYSDTKINIEDRIDGKYETNTINSEYRRLDNEDISLLDQTIDFVLECVNNKDYAKLYQMVPNDYRKLKYPDITIFTDYINNTFNNAPYTCLSYRLYIEANYIKIQDADGKIMELKLTPFYGVEETKIAFDNIKSISILDTRFKNQGIWYDLKAVAKYEENISVFFEVTNGNDEDVEIALENIKLATIIRGVEEEIVSNASKTETIKANETKMVEVYLDTAAEIYYTIDSISLDIITSGKKQYVKQYIQYYHDEDL